MAIFKIDSFRNTVVRHWWQRPLFSLIIIIIIFVTSYAVIDLFRPRLIVSSKVFKDVFVHFVSNSALFSASCSCSFLIHVVASLICIILVSRQLVLLSTLPEFLHTFCNQKGCTPLFLWKISSRWIVIFPTPPPPFSEGPNFASV